MSTYSTDLYPHEVHDAVKALYKALGEPTRDDSPINDYDSVGECIHPVFGLTEHFRGNDEGNLGYTGNKSRGDHISIPAFCESGEVMALDVSFHKGYTYFTLCTFPEGPKEVHAALFELLFGLETR